MGAKVPLHHVPQQVKQRGSIVFGNNAVSWSQNPSVSCTFLAVKVTALEDEKGLIVLLLLLATGSAGCAVCAVLPHPKSSRSKLARSFFRLGCCSCHVLSHPLASLTLCGSVLELCAGHGVVCTTAEVDCDMARCKPLAVGQSATVAGLNLSCRAACCRSPVLGQCSSMPCPGSSSSANTTRQAPAGPLVPPSLSPSCAAAFLASASYGWGPRTASRKLTAAGHPVLACPWVSVPYVRGFALSGRPVTDWDCAPPAAPYSTDMRPVSKSRAS